MRTSDRKSTSHRGSLFLSASSHKSIVLETRISYRSPNNACLNYSDVLIPSMGDRLHGLPSLYGKPVETSVEVSGLVSFSHRLMFCHHLGHFRFVGSCELHDRLHGLLD